VPVETDHLDGLGFAAGHPASLVDRNEREQHDDADGDVHAVKPREGVEARAKEAGGEAQPLVVERRELVHLATDERGSEECRDGEPQVGAAVVLLGGGRHCQHHRERAHEQDETAHRGERDVVDLFGGRAVGNPAAIQHVGGDEATEEEALRTKEQPHAELHIGKPRARGVRVVRDGGLSHGWPQPYDHCLSDHCRCLHRSRSLAPPTAPVPNRRRRTRRGVRRRWRPGSSRSSRAR